jgi:hypothetical protein
VGIRNKDRIMGIWGFGDSVTFGDRWMGQNVNKRKYDGNDGNKVRSKLISYRLDSNIQHKLRGHKNIHFSP